MKKPASFLALIVAAGVSVSAYPGVLPQAQGQESSAATLARRIGAIKTIQGNTLTLTPDSGPDVAVTVEPNARMLKIAPGAKDLKDATPVQLQDLQVGDRVRVRGRAGSDPNSIAALEIVVMARTDLEARHHQEQQDWQKRGVGGLVRNIDPGTGTVTISVTGFGGKKDIAVQTTKNTVFRRYAPDSVKFDDAKSSTLAEIRAGDQLRARGQHSPDGSELTAEEVVTGSFRNVAGTVNSVNAGAGTVSVQDLLTKKAIVVKITPESQLHSLPPEFAQRIAARLKASAVPGMPAAGSGPGATAEHAQSRQPAEMKPGHETNGQTPPGGMNGGSGGAPDLQQMLNRMPVVTLADLHRGDALLIVATEGSDAGATAITLLSGVEPILQAAPGRETMMLTPWSLGGAPAGDTGQ
ncbi:MAG TPA: DUF5666 domain-containing protein [Candidatus Sulfotelmatobacter sp.]|nr:DUF5666 domain-containing protein [Candidatus Sulfotelmatobacter sp.]